MIGSGSEDKRKLELHAAARLVPHPKFDDATIDYDVGVIKTPFVMSDAQKPIALVDVGYEAAVGDAVVVNGWGMSLVSAPLPGTFLNIVQAFLWAYETFQSMTLRAFF